MTVAQLIAELALMRDQVGGEAEIVIADVNNQTVGVILWAVPVIVPSAEGETGRASLVRLLIERAK